MKLSLLRPGVVDILSKSHLRSRTGSIWELVQENKVSFDRKKNSMRPLVFINLDHNIIQDGFCEIFLLIFKICKGTMRYSQQWSCVTVKDTDTCVLDQISTLPWVTKVFYICRNSCQLPLNKVCNFSRKWKWHGILSLRPFSMFLNYE